VAGAIGMSGNLNTTNQNQSTIGTGGDSAKDKLIETLKQRAEAEKNKAEKFKQQVEFHQEQSKKFEKMKNDLLKENQKLKNQEKDLKQKYTML
jgi:hypothetical protein